MDSMVRIRPIKPIYYSSDRDDRQEAEEKRIALLLRLIEGMNIPKSRVISLQTKPTRSSALVWMRDNLRTNNSGHKNLNQVDNLVALLLRTESRKK